MPVHPAMYESDETPIVVVGIKTNKNLPERVLGS